MRTIKLNKKQQLKQSKGITLIALVITIIVLLILAGVSIATLTGENGILTRASDAKAETTKAEAREKIQLETAASFDNTGKYNVDTAIENLKNNAKIPAGDITKNDDGTLTVTLDGYKFKVDEKGKVDEGTKIGDNLTPPELPSTVKEAKEKGTVFDVNTKLTDDYGNPVTIPEGFKIAEESATYVGGGIVIEDATYEGTLGSQFVWIPVGTVTGTVNGEKKTETIKLSRYTFAENGKEEDQGLKTIYPSWTTDYDYQELSKSTLGNEVAKDIEEFKSSANNNSGYYLGRYEAGVTGYDSEESSYYYEYTNGQIVCKQGQQVWNYITQNKASEVSKDMYKDTLPFTSDLINSYAWDTAIVFIQTFGEESNSSTYSRTIGLSTNTSEPQATGTNILEETGETDKQCNIFDMAGNCYEWSTETYSGSIGPCVFRGGYCSSSYNYTSYRCSDSTSCSEDSTAFRPLLYL